jgi:hypothetical protein
MSKAAKPDSEHRAVVIPQAGGPSLADPDGNQILIDQHR